MIKLVKDLIYVFINPKKYCDYLYAQSQNISEDLTAQSKNDPVSFNRFSSINVSIHQLALQTCAITFIIKVLLLVFLILVFGFSLEKGLTKDLAFSLIMYLLIFYFNYFVSRCYLKFMNKVFNYQTSVEKFDNLFDRSYFIYIAPSFILTIIAEIFLCFFSGQSAVDSNFSLLSRTLFWPIFLITYVYFYWILIKIFKFSCAQSLLTIILLPIIAGLCFLIILLPFSSSPVLLKFLVGLGLFVLFIWLVVIWLVVFINNKSYFPNQDLSDNETARNFSHEQIGHSLDKDFSNKSFSEAQVDFTVTNDPSLVDDALVKEDDSEKKE